MEKNPKFNFFKSNAKVIFLEMLLPTFIPIFYTVDVIRNNVVSFLKNYVNIVYLLLHPTWVQILVIFAVFFVIPLMKLYRVQKNSEIMKSSEEMLSLLASISLVVGEKQRRFFNWSQQNETEPSKIFFNITQPIVQINKIVVGIQMFFQEVLNDKSLECYLLNIENGDVSSMKAHTCCSGKPKIEASFIKSNSYVKNCLTKNCVAIAENVDENKVDTLFNQGEIGKIRSALCFPVKDGCNVLYLCVVSSEKCTIKNDQKRLFSYVLEQFSQRILLESYLEKLLEKTK
jgi:hypothetical protein